jgi:hypothetical protein
VTSATHGESHLARSAGPGKLWVLCWCGEREVPVDADLVRRCVTDTCGALWCVRPDNYKDWCW